MSAPTASAVLAVVRAEIGYREGPNNDTKYGRWYGLNHAPWCNIFTSWGADKAGATQIIPRGAYTPASADWYIARKQYGHVPKRGAQGFVYSASVGRIHHTFLVEAVHTDGSFTTIEGNTNDDGSATGNGVYRLHRADTPGTYSFGYPKYAPENPRLDLTRYRRAAVNRDSSYPAGVLLVQKSLAKAVGLKAYLKGRHGRRTASAVKKFQGEHGQRQTGVLTEGQLKRLSAAYGYFHV